MKRRYHFAGKDNRGREIFEECGGTRTILASTDQQPLKLGEELGQIEPCDDGHYEITDPLTGADLGDHDGPARVSTNAYRRGWDEVFGKKETN